MRFSIIIPAHNAGHRIWKLLESIRRQAFEDYEVIVIADACDMDDHTVDIACAYGCRVFVIDAGNPGLARNSGLEQACGEWILFSDDDDWWINDHILEQLDREIAVMDDVPDMIQCSFVYGNKGPTVTGRGRIWPNVWSKVWRRDAIGETRFRNVYPDDDLRFVEDMLKKNIKVIGLPLLWYHYNYMRPGSITWTVSGEKL